MTYHTVTSLNEIRSMSPCEDGWAKLLKHLGKTKADDDPLELRVILESNGLDDAVWCLCVPSLERLSRHFQAWCAEQALHVFEAERPNDRRIRDQIAMLRNDGATNAERAAACAAAWAAARAAAWASAWNAARASAGGAARTAAWGAARAAAWATHMSAAWATHMSAARDAARDAPWDAHMSAVRDAARDATWDAARDAQERQLRKMIKG